MTDKLDPIDQEIVDRLSKISWENPSAFIQDKFGISKQAVTKRLQNLVAEDYLIAEGTGRGKKYKLLKSVDTLESWHFPIDVIRGEGEDRLYENSIRPKIKGINTNTENILSHICTEMLNNVMDHSDGSYAKIGLQQKQNTIRIVIEDDGIGVFQSLKAGFTLDNLNEAITELLKGRRTTDPDRHAGEGIFFSMRLADQFSIDANGILFEFQSQIEDFKYQKSSRSNQVGTEIGFRVSKASNRDITEVFRKYTDENYQFVKNRSFVVKPYLLVAHGGPGKLISRSEAKRFISGAKDAQSIIIEFADVEGIGQGFADEIFRVWAQHHPDIQILYRNANDFVQLMIKRCHPPNNVKSQ